MIYLDSSAVLKLLFEEAESAALAAWIAERAGTPLISSELAHVEVVRAVRRLDPAHMADARALTSQLDLVPINRPLIESAAEVGDPLLRALDAIHLASMVSIAPELTAVVAYDRRLIAAAKTAGFVTVQPGEDRPPGGDTHPSGASPPAGRSELPSAT